MSFLIGILSCRKNAHKQAAVRDTWMQDIQPPHQAVFIVGGAEQTELVGDTLFVDAPDSYKYLPLKMLEFWKWCLTQNHDTIFKCDDDTYLKFKRLLKLGKGAYVGNVLRRKKNRFKFCSGGAGYRVRKWYLEELIEHYPQSPTGPEDVWFARAAKAIGIVPKKASRLRFKNTSYPTPKNGVITGHWISPKQMRQIHRAFESQTT